MGCKKCLLNICDEIIAESATYNGSSLDAKNCDKRDGEAAVSYSKNVLLTARPSV